MHEPRPAAAMNQDRERRRGTINCYRRKKVSEDGSYGRVAACGLDATTPGETESGAKAPILPGEWRWRARTDHGWLAFFKFGTGAFFAISAIASLACFLPRRRRIDTESSGLRFGSGRFCDAGFAADDEC